MKHYYSWNEKIAILAEAYSVQGNIKATARKYHVDPSQIRKWLRKKVELGQQLQQRAHLKMLQKGRPALHREAFDELSSFIHQLESQHRTITVGMICRELRRIDQSAQAASMDILRHRVYRFLLKERFVQRRATHVAQNTRYCQQKIDQFVEYVTEEIQRLGIGPKCVVNIDETNVDFDMTGRVTLARRGSRTVSIRSTGSSARVTALLGVTMSGVKLEPFLIFKGQPNGRIIREFTMLHYPEGCKYLYRKRHGLMKSLLRYGLRRFGSRSVMVNPERT